MRFSRSAEDLSLSLGSASRRVLQRRATLVRPARFAPVSLGGKDARPGEASSAALAVRDQLPRQASAPKTDACPRNLSVAS